MCLSALVWQKAIASGKRSNQLACSENSENSNADLPE